MISRRELALMVAACGACVAALSATHGTMRSSSSDPARSGGSPREQASGERDALLRGSSNEQPPGELRVNLREIPLGEIRRFVCDGVPLTVRHRAPAEDRDPGDTRFASPEWIVLQARCTHLGCDLNERADARGGWLCLCHGSEFDANGRVTRGPATEDLVVPAHTFVDANTLSIECARPTLPFPGREAGHGAAM